MQNRCIPDNMLTYAERMERMKGKDAEELYRAGLEFFGEGEEWEAMQWYIAAMDLGHANATFALARISENKYMNEAMEGTEELYDSIIELYEKASDLGNKNAGIYLGNFYLSQISGEEDDYDEDYDLAEMALAAYGRAEDNGNKEAYYHIAEVYNMGLIENPANMFSGENYRKGAKADSYGGYLGLYQLAMAYGWDYIPMDEDTVMRKLKELSPYPPQ